jgi:hypothetical protein
VVVHVLASCYRLGLAKLASPAVSQRYEARSLLLVEIDYGQVATSMFAARRLIDS